jgi:hypothetical protein
MPVTSPIVVDLGSMTDLEVQELLSGTGRLLDELPHVIRLVRAGIAERDADTLLVPIVAVYSEHRHSGTRQQSPVGGKTPRSRDRAKRKIARVVRF